jgi:hypothetical protein
MPTIRTTFEPWREITVSDAEFDYLQRYGLIYTGPIPPVTPTPPPITVPPDGYLTTGTVNVYLTTDPDQLVTVTFLEYFDLYRQGLIAGTEAGGPIAYPGYTPGVPRTLESHIHADEPHPAYDDMPSLRLIFENGLV